MRADMRTFALQTKVAVAVASAFGLLVVLGKPWYGPRPLPAADAPPEVAPSLDALAATLSRWFGAGPGASAWQAFHTADLVLASLAVLAALAALGCLRPEFQQPCRLLLQLCAVASCVLLVLTFVDRPEQIAGLEPRYGTFVGLGLVVVLLATASGINALPLRRRRRTPPPTNRRPYQF